VRFESYPFEKLTALLKDVEPSAALSPITLTIGEPQFETPEFIQDVLKESTPLLKKYPKSGGEEYLKTAMIDFVARRFGVALKDDQLIPTFGTREVLFNLPQYLLFDIKSPQMAFTNPFYQIYEGAAIASRAGITFLNLDAANGFKPVIDKKQLSECDLVILNFPNNPTASTLTLDELGHWVKLALEYDFILLNDECYSEIYSDVPPPSLLEAADYIGNSELKNVLVVNSVSKRSSAPGLRSGFIAGDARLLQGYMKYRTYVGAASPLPLQRASAAAWSEETHVEESRNVYRKNFKLARDILGTPIPDATFYIWLQVEDALEFTKRLYRQYNVKVLPGEFLARTDQHGNNPGKGFIRIALVENEERTKEALYRIKECLA